MYLNLPSNSSVLVHGDEIDFTIFNWKYTLFNLASIISNKYAFLSNYFILFDKTKIHWNIKFGRATLEVVASTSLFQ